MPLTALLIAACLGVLLLSYRLFFRVGPVVLLFGAAVGLMAWTAPRLDLQWLTWAKVITLVLSTFVCLLGARVGATWRQRLHYTILTFLVLNILEVAIADAAMHYWANFAGGLLLIAGIPFASTFTVTRQWHRPTLQFDLSWSWIFGYTAWDLAVVAAHYPLHYADHFAVLAAPIIAARWGDRRGWLEARAFTLTLYALAVVLAVDVLQVPWIPSLPGAELARQVGTVLGLVGATWNLYGRWRCLPAAARVAPGI